MPNARNTKAEAVTGKFITSAAIMLQNRVLLTAPVVPLTY